MYKEQNETFDYEGMTLICKRAPKTFWPCENCALQEICDQVCTSQEFPVCKASKREDKTQVVFQIKHDRKSR